MDKRVLYIAFGMLAIAYLVCRKAQPDLLENMQAKVEAVWSGKSTSGAGNTESGADQWEKHRRDVFAARLAESKRRAVAKYPAIAVANSEMNVRFVFRYNSMVKEDSPRLKAPNWPELIADECASTMAVESHPAAAKPSAVVRNGPPVVNSIATR